jgi:hypothetical protein
MGIMAVFAGGIFGALGYINRGKTKKAAATINSKLSYIQTQNMTKKGSAYLYLYKTSNGIYTAVLQEQDLDGSGEIETSEKLDFADRTALDTYLAAHSDIGSFLCSSRVDVTGDVSGSSLSDPLTESNMIKIGYSKGTGAFTCSNRGSVDEAPAVSTDRFFDTITLTGSETFTVKLVKNTGKHYVEE